LKDKYFIVKDKFERKTNINTKTGEMGNEKRPSRAEPLMIVI
jgi:hypothetical protein